MKVKDLKQIINSIRARDDNEEVFYDGKPVKGFWWIDCSDGYVFGFDVEMEDKNG